MNLPPAALNRSDAPRRGRRGYNARRARQYTPSPSLNPVPFRSEIPQEFHLHPLMRFHCVRISSNDMIGIIYE